MLVGITSGLDGSLERDWSFDSLARAELPLRIERAFSVRLPEKLPSQADTLCGMLQMLDEAEVAAQLSGAAALRLFAQKAVELAPADAPTLAAVSLT